MKRHRIFGAGLIILVSYLAFNFETSQAIVVLSEDSSFWATSGVQGTPDPNKSFVWPIDVFSTSPDGRWVVPPSGGTIEWVTPPPYYCMKTTSSTGLGFRVQYPPDANPLNSRKNHIVFTVRSTSAYALEVRIRVKTPGDTLKDKIIRYLPEDSSNYLIDDSIIVIGVGAAYRNGYFQVLNRNMESNLQTFFPTYKFQCLNFVYARGSTEVCGITSWNRYFWVEGYADSSSIAQGKPVGFKVSLGDSSTTTSYKIDVYRAGADMMPYGGVKESGSGRVGVRFAVEEMTYLKMAALHLPE